ncbi:MAG: hypothetical protein IKZ12_06410 [Alistipes sp.]|nr:hypothetical protein [Alistipes sp.]
MKRFFTLLFGATAWLALPTTATAQSTIAKADSVLLSERTEGDERISEYRVHTPEEADYSLHYAISSSALNKSLNGNEAEMIDLKNLVQGFLSDTANHVKQVRIKGMASPDGPMALNKSLAAHRAAAMKAYLDQHYHFSKQYPVTTSSEVATWAGVRAAVAADKAVPKQAAVLAILDAKQTPQQTEAALKQHPEVWAYLAKQILPAMRKVELEIDYAVATLVEHATQIAPPKPQPVAEAKAQPQPNAQPLAEVVVIEEVISPSEDPCREAWCSSPQRGVIVDMTFVEVDY